MANGRPLRILIVDDDADWREFLRFALEDLGYEGVEARNGEEALALMEKEQFPIVLLDMSMPGLSGQEVLERMPSPRPRVVLLTSAAAEDVGESIGKSGCYYLPKDAKGEALSLLLSSLHH